MILEAKFSMVLLKEEKREARKVVENAIQTLIIKF